MKNLRESTTNEKVINYHKSFYRPENLTLIITGIVKPEQVFKALEGIQKKILSKKSSEEYIRPWQVS
jgi:predicted Zn-dependent peptidase